MKKVIFICSLLLISLASEARDTRHQYPIKEILETATAKEVLLDVPVYFGGQKFKGKIVETDRVVSTNKKTNAFMKSDREACDWVFLSAVKQLQQAARKNGMNAVIEIKSNYKKKVFVSETKYECGAGAVMAGVALKGKLVKIK